MKPASVHFIAAVFVLATAFTSAQEDARRLKPPASMAPADLFSSTAPTSSKTTAHTNVTTHTPTTHKTTTSNVTTAPPTTPNVTTAPPTTPNVTTAPPTTPNVTTAPPTTPNVTTAPPTTANVTTAPPTTPNVTTAPPTTHNTTTANVTTATTATPPTPKPTQPTNITVGNYTVKDGNKLCIMVQAAIQVQVNNSQMVGTYIVPGSADSTGKCESNTASLMITLKEGYVSMNFAKNDTTKMVFVNAVAVNLTYAFKSGVLSHLVKKNESVQLFSMTASHSYSCKSESVFLGNGIYLMFSQDRMQAFNFTNNQFGPIDLCKADQPDYRVAIGVGVVLLILIVIVVIAYLISRRKRTDGYQTL